MVRHTRWTGPWYPYTGVVSVISYKKLHFVLSMAHRPKEKMSASSESMAAFLGACMVFPSEFAQRATLLASAPTMTTLRSVHDCIQLLDYISDLELRERTDALAKRLITDGPSESLSSASSDLHRDVILHRRRTQEWTQQVKQEVIAGTANGVREHVRTGGKINDFAPMQALTESEQAGVLHILAQSGLRR